MSSLCQCLHWPSALPVSRPALCTLVHQLFVVRWHCRCTGWRELALAIVLVTVPPKGGIYNGQVFQVWSSEDALVTAPILPFTLPRRGWQMMVTSHSLVPKGLSLCQVRSRLCHQSFAYEATARWWHCTQHSCVPIRVSQCCHLGASDIPIKQLSYMQLFLTYNWKTERIATIAPGWDDHVSWGLLAHRWLSILVGTNWVVFPCHGPWPRKLAA
jgi:hypothetical protein